MKYEKYIVLFTLFAMNLVDHPAPEVKIDQGILSGKLSTDGTYFQYLGIPYATTNIENRFKAPLPAPNWDGVYKAVYEHHWCTQPVFFLVLGHEDCLKINIYVPATVQKPLPVMVYFHGGGFVIGGGGQFAFGPDFLIKHDVIVVTFNYRLGALGFLCLGIEEAPGNAGLKDQIAALKWIKQNIAAFGGNPENITVFGESAGGHSISILLAVEAAEGLFNKAIVHSGSSISSWGVNIQPVLVASLLAKALGHDTEDPRRIYEVLSKLPHKDFIKLSVSKPFSMHHDMPLFLLPCIEKKLPGVEAVLTDLPYNLLKNRPRNNMSIIHGSNSKEGLLLTFLENDKTLEEKNRRYLFASDLEFTLDNDAANTTQKIKEFYFGNQKISKKNILNLAKLNTELFYEFPAFLETEMTLANSNATVFNFCFNYTGNRNFIKMLSGYRNENGAAHADDLFYVFSSRVIQLLINKKDAQLIERITRMWTNFAKHGHPTPSSTDDLPVRWMPSTKESFEVLYIDDDMKMRPLPNPESYYLWKEIYEKYRRLHLKWFLPS